MITQFHLRDFKGHRDTQLDLGRFTVLVGDNASGKTSVLEGIAVLAGMRWGSPSLLSDVWKPVHLLRRGSGTRFELAASDAPRDAYARVTFDVPGIADAYNVQAEIDLAGHRSKAHLGTGSWDALSKVIGSATLYRLHADRIAAAAEMNNAGTSLDADGTNTAVVLAALKLADDAAFERIESAMRELIPSVQRVRVQLDGGQRGNGIATGQVMFDFRGAPSVPAHGASHGTLVVLALLTALYGPNRPNMILLDDFDHALHPRAQVDLVRMLKRVLALPQFSAVQIVATTHSPYVLDELEPSQIHAFALGADGTVQTRPLSEHPEAAKLKGTLTAGQLWSLDPEREWVLRG